MKKTIKKLTSLLLVSLLLLASVPVQSFAVFDGLKLPVIQKIEINENSQAVSLKEIDSYFTELFEYFEDSEISLDYLKENVPSLYETVMRFDLATSNFDYVLDITLATGKTYTLSADEYNVELNKLYDIEAEAYVTYENYLQAKENGAEEIEVNLCGDIYDKVTYSYLPFTEYNGTGALPLTDMVVKSITPVSSLPDRIYWDADYVDIEGAEFLIEYADGTVTTAEAVREEVDEDNLLASMERYTLDGSSLSVYVDAVFDEIQYENSAELYFSFLDAYCTAPTVLIDDSLFKSVEITDCSFDAKTAILSSLTYKLTYQDNTSVSFTREFTEQESALLALGVEINAFDGYIVSVDITLGGYNIENDTINADEYSITVYAGFNSDTYAVENPLKDVMNGPLNAVYFFINIIDRIRNFFYNLFDMIFFAF